MQVEGMRRNAIELLQPSFRARPETFNAIDMTLVISKFIIRMQHPEMLRVANINQAIVTAPTVRMNHGLKRNMSANHLLQRAFAAVRHDLGIDRAITFEDAEDDSLATSSTSSFASDATSAEVRLVHLDLACKGRSTFTFFG